jgi:hypothetical protein
MLFQRPKEPIKRIDPQNRLKRSFGREVLSLEELS